MTGNTAVKTTSKIKFHGDLTNNCVLWNLPYRWAIEIYLMILSIGEVRNPICKIIQ